MTEISMDSYVHKKLVVEYPPCFSKSVQIVNMINQFYCVTVILLRTNDFNVKMIYKI